MCSSRQALLPWKPGKHCWFIAFVAHLKKPFPRLLFFARHTHSKTWLFPRQPRVTRSNSICPRASMLHEWHFNASVRSHLPEACPFVDIEINIYYLKLKHLLLSCCSVWLACTCAVLQAENGFVYPCEPFKLFFIFYPGHWLGFRLWYCHSFKWAWICFNVIEHISNLFPISSLK